MTLEERVARLEAIFESKGKMKTEAEVLKEIADLRKKYRELSEQAKQEKGTKQKALRIEAYGVMDRINILESLFHE